MKQKFVSKVPLFGSVLLGLIFAFTSCQNEIEQAGTWDDSVVGTATVSGVVMDTFDNLLSDVDISCMGTDTRREVRMTGTSGPDGTFSLADVPSNARYIAFAKEGFATVAYTIDPKRFTSEDNIVLNPVLEFSQAVITGKIIDAASGKPYSGVQVTNGSKTVTADADGVFTIDGQTLNDYTLTYSTADGTTYTRKVSLNDFVDGTATVPTVRLGGGDIFPGLKWQDIADSQEWYFNDYRGSTGFGGKNHWSSVYLSAMPNKGYYRYEAEGVAFELRGPGPDRGWWGMTSEGDQDNLNAFVYGRKKIYEGNKILSVLVRTHNASASSPVYFGLQVVDLTAGSTKAVKIGDTKTHGDGNYSTYSFDMSPFVGHEVGFAFGPYLYRGTSGKHLPIRRMCWAPRQVNDDDWLAGNDVPGLPSGFRLTKENTTSMGINPATSFSGMNKGMNSGSGDMGARRVHNPGGQQGYMPWFGTDHLMMYWSLMYISKDVEPVNGEGYTIKTRSDVDPNYLVPESYIYSRFKISDVNDQMTMRIRTFSSANPTVFKVTAVPENGSATALSPSSNTAREASAVADGCWKFIHEKGAGDPKDYAAFTYDLSSYKGQNVVIAISVHKGDTRGGEQKMCFYGIEMN